MDFSAKTAGGGEKTREKWSKSVRWPLMFCFFRIGTVFLGIYSNLCTFRLTVGDDENHRKTPPSW